MRIVDTRSNSIFTNGRANLAKIKPTAVSKLIANVMNGRAPVRENRDVYSPSAQPSSERTPLTHEQIELLKKKYDVTNISKNEQDALLKELAGMGAVSPQDMGSFMGDGRVIFPIGGDPFKKMGYPSNNESSLVTKTTFLRPGETLPGLSEELDSVPQDMLAGVKATVKAFNGSDTEFMRGWIGAQKNLIDILLLLGK